jgi:hypothetical protein
MTRHLSGDEQLAALEGSLDTTRVAHLQDCTVCRGDVDALAGVLKDVRSDAAVPEPSPLFWDHFSARVRRAVAAEPAAPPRDWWRTAWAPVAGLLTVAAVALVVILRAPSGAPSVAQDTARTVQLVANETAHGRRSGNWPPVSRRMRCAA